MNKIEQDIKNNQLHNVYLLYGEEDYLKNKYANMLIKHIVSDRESMNFAHYEDNIDSLNVIQTASTLPFFSDYRLIHIKNSGWFKSPNEDFNNYLNNITDTTIIVFEEASIDKRSKAYKNVDKSGVAIDFHMYSDNDIKRWIGHMLNDNDKLMEKEAVNEFIIRTNSSMTNMVSELEKLVNYVGDRQIITIEDVNVICIKQLQSKIFDMISAIAKKDLKGVLDLYHDLLLSNEAPIKILILIERQFQRSLKIKDLREAGYSNERIAKDLKIQSFIISKELSLTKNFTKESILNLLNDACNLEEDIKTGKIKDRLAVELLMTKYAG